MDTNYIPAVESAIYLFMRANNLSQQDMARIAGVSQPAVGNLLKRGFGANAAKKWSVIFGFNPDFLLTGKGDLMLPGRENETIVKKQDSEQYDTSNTVPLLPIFAQAGHLNGWSDAVTEVECERVISPIKDIDMAVHIYGESMYPDIPNGSVVYVRRVKSILDWGKAYILDTVDGPLLKYLTPGQDDQHFRCISANHDPRYAPFEVRREDVLGIYRVVMCMSMK